MNEKISDEERIENIKSLLNLYLPDDIVDDATVETWKKIKKERR